MTNEKTKELEARITELEKLVQTLNDEIDAMNDELEDMNGDITSNHKMARAVCELQEELVKQFPTIYIANKIDAPTRVGMQ